MKTQLKARVDRAGLKVARFVFIQWDDNETLVVDDETGCVLYSRPTTGTALKNAIHFAHRRHFTIRRVVIPERDAEAYHDATN